MLRFVAGVVSALLLVGAGVFFFRSSASTEVPTPQPRAAVVAQADDAEIDDPLPSASAKTREEKRFARVDKDKNGQVARAEYLASRTKAFAKLDTNGDGKLSFDEWAIKTTDKFAGADKDKSGSLTPVEFATTAVKRKARVRVPCPQPREAEAD